MQALERLNPGYGIAAMRIMVGVVLFMAGYSKIVGPGVAGITGFFGNAGIPMAPVMAPIVIGIELIGGVLLIAGAFTRFIGPVMIVQFLVAGLVVSLPSSRAGMRPAWMSCLWQPARCSSWLDRGCSRLTAGWRAAGQARAVGGPGRSRSLALDEMTPRPEQQLRPFSRLARAASARRVCVLGRTPAAMLARFLLESH